MSTDHFLGSFPPLPTITCLTAPKKSWHSSPICLSFFVTLTMRYSGILAFVFALLVSVVAISNTTLIAFNGDDFVLAPRILADILVAAPNCTMWVKTCSFELHSGASSHNLGDWAVTRYFVARSSFKIQLVVVIRMRFFLSPWLETTSVEHGMNSAFTQCDVGDGCCCPTYVFTLKANVFFFFFKLMKRWG